MDDYDKCIIETMQAAREIAKDDPDLLSGELSGFLAVMWPDDEHRKRYGFDQDTYQAALQSAWHRLRGC